MVRINIGMIAANYEHHVVLLYDTSLLFAGAIQRTTNERLPHRVMFGTLAVAENPGPGRPEKDWAQCLADDIRVVQATEGSTDSCPLLFGVETVL